MASHLGSIDFRWCPGVWEGDGSHRHEYVFPLPLHTPWIRYSREVALHSEPRGGLHSASDSYCQFEQILLLPEGHFLCGELPHLCNIFGEFSGEIYTLVWGSTTTAFVKADRLQTSHREWDENHEDDRC